MLVVAGPLDAAAAAEPVVAHAAVVARSPLRARLPALERPFGVLPLHQRLAVLVPQPQTTGVVEEDVEVGTCLAGRFDRFLRQVDGAVGVGEGAGLLAPGGGGQYHVGQLGGLG